MKQDFNKQQYIVLMDGQGNQRRFLKRDIQSFRSAEAESVVQTIIAIENSLNRGEIIEIGVQEKSEEVLRLLNGEPSPEDIAAWSRDIIEDRQKQAKNTLDNKTSQFNERIEQLNNWHEANLARAIPELTRSKLDVEKTKKTIESSPILQRAEAAFKLAQTREPGSLSYKASMAVFQTLAMSNATLISERSQQEKRAERAEENLQNLKRDAEAQKTREQLAYDRQRTHLENQMNDSQMLPGDKDILAKKIKDYRLGHAEPEFKFRRDPNAEQYRQERIAPYEQERGHIRGLSRGRHRSGHDLER